MKKLLLVLVVGLLGFSSFGQERTNREKLSFDTTSAVMSEAIGWAYNETTGEWVDYKNVISDRKEYKDKYKSLQGEYMMSRIKQSFLSMQSKTLTYKDTTYYILIVEKWSGAYKYPSIKEDWYTFKKTIGYIFTKNEYEKLLKIDGLVEAKSFSAVSMGSGYENYDEVKFLDLIQTNLLKPSREGLYTFPVMESKECVIRFFLPDFFYGQGKSYGNKYDFEKQYFEVDFENFTSILLH